MSPKQSMVINHFRDHIELTLTQAVELIGGNIYHNKPFHVANVLRNMERKNMLVKLRRAVWGIGKDYQPRKKEDVMPAMREWAKEKGIL